jgi:hypothetical protein
VELIARPALTEVFGIYQTVDQAIAATKDRR